MVFISLAVVLFGIRLQGDWEVFEGGLPRFPAMEPGVPGGRDWPRVGWFRGEVMVFGAAFLLAFGYGGVFQTLLPLRSGLLLGFDAGDTAMLMTTGYVADLLLLMPVGWLSDRKGKIQILAAGLASLLLGAFLFGNANGTMAVYVSAILLGASFSTWMIPAAIVAARSGSRTRGKALGLYRFIVDSGYILGPVILGFIVEHQGYRIAGMTFAALVGCILLILLWTTLTSEDPG